MAKIKKKENMGVVYVEAGLYKGFKNEIKHWINLGHGQAVIYKDDVLKVRMEHADFTIGDREWWLFVNGDGRIFVELVNGC